MFVPSLHSSPATERVPGTGCFPVWVVLCLNWMSIYKTTNMVQMYIRFSYTYTRVHTLTHTHTHTPHTRTHARVSGLYCMEEIHLNEIKTCSNINIFIDTDVVVWTEFQKGVVFKYFIYILLLAHLNLFFIGLPSVTYL